MEDDARATPDQEAAHCLNSHAPQESGPAHSIVVVGASAGGVEALARLVAGFPADLPAAVFVVLHIPATARSHLPQILSRSGPLPATHPADGERIVPGQIYIAPPDHHLLVMRDVLRVTHGPTENHSRPAVDPLFRSAALAYGPQVIGVVLSGALNDGTAGLLAIQQRGGITIVQHPDDALMPDMPQNALAYVDVDYSRPVAELGPLIATLARQPAAKGVYPVSEQLQREVHIAEGNAALIGATPPGSLTVYACPDCGGPLWEVDENQLLRFRCRNGHAYTGESVLDSTDIALEEALWEALTTLENSAMMAEQLATQSRSRGSEHLAEHFAEKAEKTRHRADIIRQVLLSDNWRDARAEADGALDATGTEGASASSD